MASRISDVADAETTAVRTTDGGSRPSSISETASCTYAEREEIPDVLANNEAETKSGNDNATYFHSRIGSISVARPPDASSTEISELFNRGIGVEVNESGVAAKPTQEEDFSVRSYGMKKSDCRGVNDATPLQAQTSATPPITPGGRHNPNETRQLNRPIHQMESISESRNIHSEETQDGSEDENDRLITIVNDNFKQQLNSNETIAPASSSLSAPRRRIRVSGESTGNIGGNGSVIESGRDSGGSSSRSRHGRSYAERSSLPALGGNEEDNVGDENTQRRRRASGNSLPASLDAGMASLRRWIRARRYGGGTDAGRSSGQSSSSMTTRLGEEDIFALSHTRSDIRHFSTPASSDSSDPNVNIHESNSRNGFLYYRPFEVRVQNDCDADIGIYGSDDESGSRSILLHPLESSIESDRRQQLRQRSHSEPDRARIVDFFSPNTSEGAVNPDRNYGSRALRHSSSNTRPVATTSPIIVEEVDYNDQDNYRMVRQELQHPSGRPSVSDELDATAPSSSPPSGNATELTRGRELVHSISPNIDNTPNVANGVPDRRPLTRSDPDQEARIRWMQINRRFTGVLASVAVLFSLLLFCIMIAWVLLTSTYVLSRNKVSVYYASCFFSSRIKLTCNFNKFQSCDVPLRAYFWLVSIQLLLDIFRADIMKRLCRWRPDSNRQVPPRIILYNTGYVRAIF